MPTYSASTLSKVFLTFLIQSLIFSLGIRLLVPRFSDEGLGLTIVTVVALIPVLLLISRSKLTLDLRPGSQRITPKTVILVVSLTVAISVVGGAMAAMVEKLFSTMGLPLGTGLGQESNLSFWIVLCSCVVAPIAEEIAWRGVMLRALAPWGKTAAVWLSALGFGLTHHDVLQGISATCAGLLLGWVAWNYGVIYACVVHAFLNSRNTFARWAAAPDSDSQQLHVGNTIVALVTLLALVIAICWLIAKLWARRRASRKYAARDLKSKHPHQLDPQPEPLRSFWRQPLLWLFIALETGLTIAAMLGS